MDTNQKQEEGKGISWWLWLPVALLVIVGGYYFFMRSTTDIDKKMEKVRKAKEEKRLANLVDNVSEN
jgi:cytochrome c-type biogenesis protein CcmH/NrfF